MAQSTLKSYQLSKQYTAFMESRGSLLCSQKINSGPCSEPVESYLHTSSFPEIPFNIVLPAKVFQVTFFLRFLNKILNTSYPAHFILLAFITSNMRWKYKLWSP